MNSDLNLKWGILDRLIELEAGVHYDDPSPKGQSPITFKLGKGKVLISAPHGARTARKDFKNPHIERRQYWHEEDEFTAGLAMLLAELTGAHAIATTWRIDDHDPNFDPEKTKAYKSLLADIKEKPGFVFVLDLHGASEKSKQLANTQLVDLGWGNERGRTISVERYSKIQAIINGYLGDQATERCGFEGFNASAENRTITNYCHTSLGHEAIQIEMKPQVRVIKRRPSATLFPSCVPYEADPKDVLAMISALVDIVGYLQAESESQKGE